MHRSGTSCLAGSLQEAGLYLGEVNTAAPHNAKGNRENRAIMELQDDLLRVNGGSWDNPPHKVVWPKEHQAWRDAIIASYPTDHIWGFKDPRTLLTLSGWMEALPSIRFAGTFRHPLAVAASLHARNKIDTKHSLTLWMAYNHLLLEYHKRFNFPIVCFDWPPERYHQTLLTLAPTLNLSVPKMGFSFFESALRKNVPPPEKIISRRLLARLRSFLEEKSAPDHVVLPKTVATLYRQLKEIAA